jgi:hypothetical protein
MMLVPLVMPAVLMACDIYSSTFDSITVPLLSWLFNGSPLLVSFILSIALKHRIPAIILLVSTIAYGIWFFYVFANVSYLFLWLSYGTALLALFIVGPFSLPVMIPAWIAAIVIEIRHRKKATLSQEENAV